METIKYSVIIPVYKAEKTLCRCVDSLLSQPHDHVEILLINDGSPDRSGELCQEYARNNTCIRYLEKRNGGVSSARNCGLDHAKGRYLLFVDSDDCVTQDYFSSIDAVLAEYDYDLVQFSNYFTDGFRQTKRIRESFKASTRKELFQKLIETFCEKKSNGPVAKVYSRSIVETHHIRFPEDMEVGEDRAFYIHYSLYINSFCISEHAIYIVNTENESSLSRKHRDDLDEQTARLNTYLGNAIQRSSIPSEERAEYLKAMNYDCLRMIYAKAKTLHRDNVRFFRRLKLLRGYCRDLNRQKHKYPDSLYCRVTSLPVRWGLVHVIDAMAWKLTR